MTTNAPPRRRRALTGLLALLLAAAFACGGEADDSGAERQGTDAGKSGRPAGASGADADDRISVYVVNYPLWYFAQRIGGDAAQVEFPIDEDGDPAYWQPDAETIAAYQGADLIVRNGASYAKWMELVTLPTSRIVDTSTSFADRLITIEGAVTHAHGPEGEHSHGETAFTTWLDLGQAIAQADAIREAMAAARPGRRDTFDRNFESLREDLEQLDRRLVELTTAAGEIPLLGSHPVYQYLARRYGLDLQSVHLEPGEMPDAGAWADLDGLLEEHPAAWMLWEAEPMHGIIAELQARGVESVVFDPCANRPVSGDFLSVMSANVDNLARALAAHGGGGS